MLKIHLFRRVTIVGVGLMGGSLGMAIKKHGLAHEVVGFSPRQSTLVTALKNHAIDVAESDIVKAVQAADLIVLAAPVDSIMKLFPKIAPHIRKGCIVTDMGSSKVDLVETAEKCFQNLSFFVGSHPLVGSEKHGVENATAELFEKSKCIMTPTVRTNPVAKEKVKQLWSRIGSEVVFMTAEEHDTVLAHISHLAHLLAFGFMETVPKEYLAHATQSFKDLTRIASSSPQMWIDIFISNKRNVIKALDALAKNLAVLRKAILDKDQVTLLEHFTQSKEKRDGI